MPHVGSYFLYAASSAPSQTLTASQAGSPEKLKVTPTDDRKGRQAGLLCAPLLPSSGPLASSASPLCSMFPSWSSWSSSCNTPVLSKRAALSS